MKPKLSGCNRAEWNDYHEPRHYMVTIVRNDDIDIPFSRIYNGCENNDRPVPVTDLTPLGRIIRNQLFLLPKIFPEIRIYRNIIMPDHLHFLIYIREWSEAGLSGIINEFKGNCTKDLHRDFPKFATDKISMFSPNFHDRIVYREGMVSRLKQYIIDNPRRYLVRKLNPDYFDRCRIITNGGKTFHAYGNIHLLKDPCRAPLVVSSRYSAEEKEAWEMAWQQTAHAQGVFISPFYSKEEKRLMRGFEEKGCRIIKLVDYPFYERFKPQGRDFELCSQGRLLLISIPGFLKNGKVPTRQLCLDLNEQARQISNLMENDWRARPLRF